jgi:hypothetical protein
MCKLSSRAYVITVIPIRLGAKRQNFAQPTTKGFSTLSELLGSVKAPKLGQVSTGGTLEVLRDELETTQRI